MKDVEAINRNDGTVLFDDGTMMYVDANEKLVKGLRDVKD